MNKKKMEKELINYDIKYFLPILFEIFKVA